VSDETEVVLSPSEAARRLGVSPSGLRRLAGVYGEVYGDLPKDSSGTSRLWSQEAVMRLEAARALMAAGQARSIPDALVAVESGAAPRVEMAIQDGRVADALGVVAAQLEALRDDLREIPALRAEVKALRAELGSRDAQRPAAIPPVFPMYPRAFGAGEWVAAETTPEAPGAARADRADADGGVLVRLARRLERIVQGRR